jgi:hypothetical protein
MPAVRTALIYANAQDLPDISIINIRSAVLNEERRISIYCPPKFIRIIHTRCCFYLTQSISFNPFWEDFIL